MKKEINSFISKLKQQKGSSIILLAMVFVAMSIVMSSAIIISRRLVVKSECEAFGNVWTKAILSEYDVYLLSDYGIMAYFGNEAEVRKKVDTYLRFSCADKLDVSLGSTASELQGLELGIPDNFREAIDKKSLAKRSASGRIARVQGTVENAEQSSRTIENRLVLDTLPSAGATADVGVVSIIRKLKNSNNADELLKSIGKKGGEFSLIRSCFDNHVTKGFLDGDFFVNEWEYIVAGKQSDQENYKSCYRKIYLIRNALNLFFLENDREKRNAIIMVSEMISPEAPLITQAIITEAWALAETENDMKLLLDNKAVPFIKTNSSWHTSLNSVIQSDSVAGKLDDEGKRLLNENINNIEGIKALQGQNSDSSGQNYDDYLILLMLSVSDNLRTLRCMDLVQINMKYKYYRDFNMMEYYTGVRFCLKANGYTYEFSDYYR